MRLGAWSVHLLTSSGIVAGFFSIVCIAENKFLWAFFWLFVAFIIDAIDGTFARIFRVGEVLPNMSGKTIDYVVDFCNYAVVPAFLMYAAKNVDGSGTFLLTEEGRIWGAAVVLLVSAVYYGKEGMVSSDYYFIGFPVMWNFVAFYVYYVFNLPPIGNLIAVFFFAALHFVPIKFLYPSRTRRFMALNVSMSVLFVVSNAALLLLLEVYSFETGLIFIMRLLSLLSVGYFGGIAVYNTWFDPTTKNVK